MRKLHDKYFKQAKREGHLARSYYKLREINRRNRIIKKGDRVLDLGSCPGSWLEYILPAIGPRGMACAVDLKLINKQFKDKVVFIKKDVRELTSEDFSGVTTSFNVIVSDMAPNTSGVKSADQARSIELCEAALDLATNMLAAKGNFVCKVLEGPDLPDLRHRLAKCFTEVKVTKPDASRDESMETYLVGLGWLEGGGMKPEA